MYQVCTLNTIYTQYITFHITDDVARQQEIWEIEKRARHVPVPRLSFVPSQHG
jgi:hypothetical protein